MDGHLTREAGPEQRRHHRHTLSSAATVLRDERRPRLCWVKNMSIDGALLCGIHQLPVGTNLRLLLHLPWYQPIAVDCRVVHQDISSGGDRCVGVEFLHEGSTSSTAIQRAIEAAGRCRLQLREPAVLMITDRAAMRREVERDLAGTGIRLVTAETPLDSIGWLQDFETEIDSVIIDLALEQANALSFLRFLAEEFPSVKRIVITDGEIPTLERVAYRYGRCSAVLESPWKPRRLRKMLDRLAWDEHEPTPVVNAL
jgi:CheY-like chemotaxis protein